MNKRSIFEKVDNFNLSTDQENEDHSSHQDESAEEMKNLKVKIYDILLNKNDEYIYYWDQISDEIMLYIFEYMDNSFDLVNISLVSKRWNAIGEDNRIWEKLYTVHLSKKLDYPLIIPEKWKQYYLKKKYDYILSPKQSPEKLNQIKHYGSPTTKKFLFDSLRVPENSRTPFQSNLKQFMKKKKKKKEITNEQTTPHSHPKINIPNSSENHKKKMAST